MFFSTTTGVVKSSSSFSSYITFETFGLSVILNLIVLVVGVGYPIVVSYVETAKISAVPTLFNVFKPQIVVSS